MRISARAETLAQHAALGASVPANSGQALGVGVAHSDPEKGVFDDGEKDDDPEEINQGNPAVVWLISGLDTSASPAAQISCGQAFERPASVALATPSAAPRSANHSGQIRAANLWASRT